MKYFLNTLYPYGIISVKGIDLACEQILHHSKIFLNFNCRKPVFAENMQQAWHQVQGGLQREWKRDS